DHYENTITPGVLRLLNAAPGERILDVACGQGDLARHLAEHGCEAIGVDASERLVEIARERAGEAPAATPPRFLAGDARNLLEIPDLLPSAEGDAGAEHRRFDAITCVMSLMNIEPV